MPFKSFIKALILISTLRPGHGFYIQDFGLIDDEFDNSSLLIKPKLTWNKEEYPNPRLLTQFKFCRQVKPTSICDPDDILTKIESHYLDQTIQKVHADSECMCSECEYIPDSKLRVAIAIMDYMFKPYNHPRKVAKDFAEYLMRKWSMGDCGNGILILLSVSDRQFYPALGDAVLKRLPHGATDAIFFKAKSHFTNGHNYEGLLSMVNSYASLIKNPRTRLNDLFPQELNERVESKSNIPLIIGLIVLFLVLIVLIGGMIYFIKKRKSEEPKLTFKSFMDKSFWIRKKPENDTNTQPKKKVNTSGPTTVKVYEPCSIEDLDVDNQNDYVTEVKQRLDSFSSDSSEEDEDDEYSRQQTLPIGYSTRGADSENGRIVLNKNGARNGRMDDEENGHLDATKDELDVPRNDTETKTHDATERNEDEDEANHNQD